MQGGSVAQYNAVAPLAFDLKEQLLLRILAHLLKEGLVLLVVVDRDQALQALASADQNLPLQTEDQDDLEGIEVSEEDRKLLFKILRAADQVGAGGARAVNADVQGEAEAA